MMKTKFTAIDLFAGIGGFRLAVEKCGGECINFSEIDADAIRYYEENYNESHNTNLGDVTKIADLPEHDLLTGGVPCQSWSIAGKNLGFDDDRGQLWNDAIYLLNKSRPKAFVFENVKGLVDPRNKDALNYILSRIKDSGYFADIYVINSFDYGVPQSRVRIYIIGFREERFFDRFRLPEKPKTRMCLRDILNEVTEDETASVEIERDLFGEIVTPKKNGTALSTNNNGFNDYFLFNDLRNGFTTIHSWDILDTTERQKAICLLLLRNRRKGEYGSLDGNPLSLAHFKSLDKTITQKELDGLVELGIFKEEKYAFSIKTPVEQELSTEERVILSKQCGGILVTDLFAHDKKLRIAKKNFATVLESLEAKGVIMCSEVRYDFKYTKISTGLFGVNRIFLPSSNVYPTLVASDSNDFITPISIAATTGEAYRERFLKEIFQKKNYRKITKEEACKIQGFPPDFKLPDSRARWMKLIGNSVSVPVIEQLVHSICKTGVFQ